MSKAPLHIALDTYDPLLVCHLPLWYPYDDMRGSNIKSYDKYSHSCIVTGGVFGSQGWTVDGDDYISCTDCAALQITTSVTICAWVNPNDLVGNGYIFSKGGYSLYLDSDEVPRFETRKGDDSGWDIDSVSGALTIGASNFVCAIFDDVNNTKTTYTNLVAGTPVAKADALWPAVGTNISVGSYAVAPPNSTLIGVVGDVIVYSGVKSITEIYEKTKWRYR